MSDQQQNPQGHPTQPLPEGQTQPEGPVITPPSPNLSGVPPERHPETEAHIPPAPPPLPPTEPARQDAPGTSDPNYRGPIPTPGQPQTSLHGQPEGEPTPTGAKPSEGSHNQNQDQGQQGKSTLDKHGSREPPEPDDLEETKRKGGHR